MNNSPATRVGAGSGFSGALQTLGRLLTFRADSDELHRMNGHHLALGLLLTWLAGMGRWWEDPKAGLLQHLGIGSVVYVFVLAFFLWLLFWPLSPSHWSLLNIITFVSLTSPPAFLYAIPVRHGLEMHTAQTVRLWLLAIVAGWRVGLLAFYMRRGAGLAGGRLVTSILFPLVLILFVLTALNLERVVFNFMGGITAENRSVNDAAYGVLFLLTLLSALAFLPLMACYIYFLVGSLISKYGGRISIVFYCLTTLGTGGAILLWIADLAYFAVCSGLAALMFALTPLMKFHEMETPREPSGD